VLLDDSLSAVDSHTSQSLVQDCFLRGPMAKKTRILITHALHVLDKVDYIYVMDEGSIVEHGTFAVCQALLVLCLPYSALAYFLSRSCADQDPFSPS
jgi:ABC-type bacteriocin/lantibiotic exporter with double-glycine peptidase domain